MQQIAVHPTHLPGKFSTLPEHIAQEKISGVERGAAYLMNKARLIGSQATRWAESMLQERGIQGVRVLQGLLSLASRHGDQDVEQACEIAQSHGAYRLRVIRELLKRRAATSRSNSSLWMIIRSSGGWTTTNSSSEPLFRRQTYDVENL